MQRFLAALIISFLTAGFAHAGATGTVSYKGQSWPVADALAVTDLLDTTKLAFAPVRWDRAAWSDNGIFDMFDIYSFEDAAKPLFLEIVLDKEGEFSSLQMSEDFGKSEGTFRQPWSSKAERLEGIKVDRLGSDSVAGSAKFKQGEYAVDVKFDLALMQRNARLEPPGSPLPLDGGEPGKVLLATLAAAAAGDVPQMLALTHPDRREQMNRLSASPDFAAHLAKQKSLTPTEAKISGGKVHEDLAWIDFNGNAGGRDTRYSAKLGRVDGVWYVERLSIRETD